MENLNLSAPKLDYMYKFQKHVQQGSFSFNFNFVSIIVIIESLRIPKTKKYFFTS